MLALLLSLLVGVTGLDRPVDAHLAEIAAQRAVEIQSDFSHAGKRPGTTEIIAYNAGYADPVGQLVVQWRNSPAHWAILSNPDYDRWGCAVTTVGNSTYGVCVFARASVANTGTTPLPTGWPLVLLLLGATLYRAAHRFDLDRARVP